ncbi:unnamed protein product [Pocillopora meandrina]|uniref:Uncharacterized protein n=1 Tax=Pocillopora meandrina TaxID=46732 RepID=A0AAU9WN92_9CNID|nr:unnamed protein product [Pocillopora meandrina]
MAHMSLGKYLDQELLSFRHPHIASRHPHIASPRLQLPDAQLQCERWFEPPYDEMVAYHLRALWAVANGDYVEA